MTHGQSRPGVKICIVIRFAAVVRGKFRNWIIEFRNLNTPPVGEFHQSCSRSYADEIRAGRQVPAVTRKLFDLSLYGVNQTSAPFTLVLSVNALCFL